MAKGGVVFTKDNEYYTPRYVVDYFGKFDYDPATVKEKAEEFGIDNYDTIETNGLRSDWTKYKRIWINPPFTRKMEFVRKAQNTYDKAKNDIYILFPIEFLTTKDFARVCRGGTLYIPDGRINFESGLGKTGKSPAFGSVILKLGDEFKVEMVKFVKSDPNQLKIIE